LTIKVPAPFAGISDLGFTAQYRAQQFNEPQRDVPLLIEGPEPPMRRLAELLQLLSGTESSAYAWSDPVMLSDEVVVLEQTDIRSLAASRLAPPPTFVVIDVSFISLKLVLPAALALVQPPAQLVALIKPQFEVGRGEVGKGGIVRDDAKRAAAVQSVVEFARSLGFEVRGVIESPIKGAEGNIEYLMYGRLPRGEVRSSK